MSIVACVFCGVDFERPSVYGRACSSRCKDKNSRGYPCETCGEVFVRRDESHRKCRHCSRVPKHGTVNEYKAHRCRCDSCRSANAAYQREYEATLPVGRTVACAGCGCRMRKGRTTAREGIAKCLPCRRSVHGAIGYTRGCRCEVCTDGRAREMREYGAKRKAEGRPLTASKPTVERECDECGAVYSARRDQLRSGGGRLCSRKCASIQGHRASGYTGDASRLKHAEARKRHLQFGKMGSVRWRALRRAKAALELSGGNRVFVNGPCLVCGLEFTAPGQFARYCSAACRDRNSKQGFGLSFLDRMFLFARDEWLCHLCGLMVEYGGVDEYDPRMATLDHLIPQAHGGGHEFDNLSTAHSLCNSVRRELPVSMFRSHEAVSELRKRLFEAVNGEA